MSSLSLSRRQWLVTVGIVLVAIVVIWGLRAGYLPEIGKFFAYEQPGYVPPCGWHGEPISGVVQQCCNAFVEMIPVLSPVPTPATITPPPVPTGDGSLVLRVTDPGALYCTADGAGDDRSPSLAWEGPALPTTDTPVEILRFNPGSGEYEVIRTMNTQNYYYLDVDSPYPRPLLYQIRLVADPTVVSNVIEFTFDCARSQWNPNPAYCAMPECSVVQQNTSCGDFPCPPPDVQVVCPPGVTPPPRPSETPTPTDEPITFDSDSSPDYLTVNPYPLSPSSNPDLFTSGYARGLEYAGAGGDTEPSIIGPDGSYTPSNDGYWYVYDHCTSGQLNEAFIQSDGRLGANAFPAESIAPYRCENGALVSDGPEVSLPPGDYPALGLNGGIPEAQVIAGQVFTVSAHLDTGSYAVTAVKLVARIDGNASFVRITPSGSSSLFPDILEGPVVESQVATITVGSGVDGGRTGTGFGLANFEFTTPADSAPGSTFDVIITSESEVAAANQQGNVLQGGGSVRYTVLADDSIPGDADGDNDVDIFDYSIVVTNFGKTGSDVPGDVDHDGDVDIFDYSIVVTNFGQTRG